MRYQVAEKFSLVKSPLIPGNKLSKSFRGTFPLQKGYKTANKTDCFYLYVSEPLQKLYRQDTLVTRHGNDPTAGH